MLKKAVFYETILCVGEERSGQVFIIMVNKAQLVSQVKHNERGAADSLMPISAEFKHFV